MSRRPVRLVATAMCAFLTTLAGCSLIGEGASGAVMVRRRRCSCFGADELARRVPGVVLTGYVGCDSRGDSAYVEWTHPSFARLKLAVLALDCTPVPEATSDQTCGLDCQGRSVVRLSLPEMSDKTGAGECRPWLRVAGRGVARWAVSGMPLHSVNRWRAPDYAPDRTGDGGCPDWLQWRFLHSRSPARHSGRRPRPSVRRRRATVRSVRGHGDHPIPEPARRHAPGRPDHPGRARPGTAQHQLADTGQLPCPELELVTGLVDR